MQLAYCADNVFDAHLVRHALEDAGIPAFVFGEHLLGGGGELPLFGVLRVCVPDPLLPQAGTWWPRSTCARWTMRKARPACRRTSCRRESA
jgi:hypothetical protein